MSELDIESFMAGISSSIIGVDPFTYAANSTISEMVLPTEPILSDESISHPSMPSLEPLQGTLSSFKKSLFQDEEGWLNLKAAINETKAYFLSKISSKSSSDLTSEQKSDLTNLLFKYRILFGLKSGTTSLLSHKIENSETVFVKPRR